jgi:lipopolysaccharide transport system ATP-binding protein
MTRAEVRAQFDAILEFAELESVVDDPIRIYSSGMRMRLAFAVACHMHPDILLVDEVLAVGDASFQRKCLDRISQFKAAGCTILVVSHDSAQVRALCDEVILLRQGRMLAFGPTQEVMDQYDSVQNEEAEALEAAPAADVELPGGIRLVKGVNRFGTQEAEIEAIRVLNTRGGLTRTIMSGDGITIELDYHAKRSISSPRISLTVELTDGTACFDTNTEVAGCDIRLLAGRGTLRLEVDRLDLGGGRYALSAGIYAATWDRCYDFHRQIYPFEVIGITSGKGVLNPPHRWKLLSARESNAVQHSNV